MNILYKYNCQAENEELFNNRLNDALLYNKQDIRHFLRSDMYNFDFDFNPFWWEVDLIALMLSITISKKEGNKVYLECDSITEKYFSELDILTMFNDINNSPIDITQYTPGIPDLGQDISNIHLAGMHRKYRGLRIWQPNSIYIKQRLKDLHEAVNNVLDYSETNNLFSKKYLKDFLLTNNSLVKQGFYTPFRKDRERLIIVIRETLEDDSTVLHLCPSQSSVNLITKVSTNSLENLGVFTYYQHELWGLMQDDDYAKNVPNKDKYPMAFLYTSDKCPRGQEPYGSNINTKDPWIASQTILHKYNLPKHEYLDNGY
tara:strand:+ start:522 stop:1469 length:948 start_codon:yes stop_codon:yes gene_type:complete